MFQLCTKPEALTNLAAIIERGQVRPTDNVDAIRAFAYVSVAVASRPIPQAPRQPDQSQISMQQSTPELLPERKQPRDVAQAKNVDLLQPTSKPEHPWAGSSHQEPSIQPRQSDITTDDGVSNQAVEELGLSIRTYNILKRNEIYTLLDLAGMTEEKFLASRTAEPAQLLKSGLP